MHKQYCQYSCLLFGCLPLSGTAQVGEKGVTGESLVQPALMPMQCNLCTSPLNIPHVFGSLQSWWDLSFYSWTSRWMFKNAKVLTSWWREWLNKWHTAWIVCGIEVVASNPLYLEVAESFALLLTIFSRSILLQKSQRLTGTQLSSYLLPNRKHITFSSGHRLAMPWAFYWRDERS